MEIRHTDELAHAVNRAVHKGDVESLKQLLADNPGLAAATIVDGKGNKSSLVHCTVTWPGHFPNVAESVKALVSAGADVNTACEPANKMHQETPLHGAASSDDVDAIDALLDNGANIEARGAIFTGGTAMSDAVVFAQWNAARRLFERGAETEMWQAAALGLLDRVEKYFAAEPAPTPDEITGSFWNACRGGHRNTAEYLLDHGANINWLPPWDRVSPLDGAGQSGNTELVEWLKSKGAKSAKQM